uniref:Tc1-like transposase DDE domain-containing protein n=1 Tax=Acrobeloides nanus TaxID=290746 RepID=A0A914EGD4_9BILA
MGGNYVQNIIAYKKMEKTQFMELQRLLDEVILPACEEVYTDGNFVFQQDGAPSHKDKRTQRYLEEHAPFIPASQWPAYSPDLNPCDYRLWAWMKQKLYERGTALNLDELKARIREVRDELDVRTIRKWLRELRPRLQKVIDDGGKPIQQYFNKVCCYCLCFSLC